MKRTQRPAARGNSCIDRAMFVLVCLIFSPAMIYLGLSSLYDDYELRSRGATVEARLTDTEVEKISGNRESYHVKYEFTLEGGKTRYSCSDRTGRRNIWCGVTAEQWRLTQATQRVAVRYLPDRPWTNQPVHGTISIYDSMGGVLAGVGPWIILALILIFNIFNERADRAKGGPRSAAIKVYSETLKRHPDQVFVLVQRGLALQEERRLEEAIADYDRAIQLDPNYGPAYYGRGWAKDWLQDYKGALADAQQGFRLDPRSPGTYLRRTGSALAGLKRYAEALEAYSQAIALNPADEGTIFNRAICYFESGQYELALKDINRALELDPDWDWAFYRRGQIYERTGELDLAIRDYQQALHYNPGYKPAAEALRRARRR
jgi:tetratricopeptide (TPR) repeat protein